MSIPVLNFFEIKSGRRQKAVSPAKTGVRDSVRLPGVMIGVQQVVRPLAEGRAQILPVQSLHLRILVGEADGGAWRPYPTAAAPRTAARSCPSRMGCPPPPAQPPGQAMTSTKSYSALPLVQRLHQCPGVGQAAGHRHPDISDAGNAVNAPPSRACLPRTCVEGIRRWDSCR